jgi:hypothetical protein
MSEIPLFAVLYDLTTKIVRRKVFAHDPSVASLKFHQNAGEGIVFISLPNTSNMKDIIKSLGLIDS